MDYSVDIESEYQKAKSKIFRLSLLFSLILTITIISDVLLIVFAKEEYLVNLIISIIITIAFLWFAIFFISMIYKDVNDRYRYFRGYDSGLKATDDVIFIEKEDELTYVNGLYVYLVRVRFNEGLKSQDKIIYTLNKDLDFKKGDKLTITTYQRILTKAVINP